ncbi:MAG: CehA/McbA family metallohydrolase [bacterium]|nr:CehA/McbA family metallohydrolase [Candidatus Cloacimonadota bacterium]MDD2485724.1 CehA/McbA family metallohydrolase [bacterium]MDD3805011.1 CehA/McbA family metallohydrolase [bacterium]MDD4152393.1 CehA/McbA family metallohydrolase [bacterium]
MNRLFQNGGKWFKGNTHTHTTISDGALDPEVMAAKYRSAGYDFLCITDHSRGDCSGHSRLTDIENLNSQDFLVIPGIEVACYDGHHVVGLNIKEEIMTQHRAQEAIRQINKQGGMAILAHPYWSGLMSSDLLKIDDYAALEVFNNSTFYSVGKGCSTAHWDDLLSVGRKVFGVAADDAHYHFDRYRPNDVCGSWVMVNARTLAVTDIMDSLRNGLFYASNGPIIKSIAIDGNRIVVETSPCKCINIIAYAWNGKSYTAGEDEYLTHLEHEFNKDYRFLRVECYDSNGKTAWSNPILLDEI